MTKLKENHRVPIQKDDIANLVSVNDTDLSCIFVNKEYESIDLIIDDSSFDNT